MCSYNIEQDAQVKYEKIFQKQSLIFNDKQINWINLATNDEIITTASSPD